MESVPCAGCSTFFVPRNKCQIFCSEPDCQRVRKALWQKQKLATDPEYKEEQRLAQNKWLQNNPDYWKDYRSGHPEQADRNRSLQKIRNMKNRQDQTVCKLSKNHWYCKDGREKTQRIQPFRGILACTYSCKDGRGKNFYHFSTSQFHMIAKMDPRTWDQCLCYTG